MSRRFENGKLLFTYTPVKIEKNNLLNPNSYNVSTKQRIAKTLMNQSRYLPKFHIFNNKLNNLGFYEGGPYGSGMAPKN